MVTKPAARADDSPPDLLSHLTAEEGLGVGEPNNPPRFCIPSSASLLALRLRRDSNGAPSALSLAGQRPAHHGVAPGVTSPAASDQSAARRLAVRGRNRAGQQTAYQRRGWDALR